MPRRVLITPPRSGAQVRRVHVLAEQEQIRVLQMRFEVIRWAVQDTWSWTLTHADPFREPFFQEANALTYGSLCLACWIFFLRQMRFEVIHWAVQLFHFTYSTKDERPQIQTPLFGLQDLPPTPVILLPMLTHGCSSRSNAASMGQICIPHLTEPHPRPKFSKI
ncbi:hypothetical protein K443DRAFT_238960 [Laccaria amethystina LaAM-08-1]|uniref:Uncharacterized protein n=1 Tax=Laccaria amethystina LaAM-08-1 TaxID=1095629 RepID=A0A0C9X8D4_9AGAR|nr:hypothetical protein K443DRAFT_238960 [Laccaria amethystina LaAM-08-1]